MIRPTTNGTLLLCAMLALSGCGECPTGSPPADWKPTVLTDKSGKEYYVEYISARCFARVRELNR